jgi:hypothetical protein
MRKRTETNQPKVHQWLRYESYIDDYQVRDDTDSFDGNVGIVVMVDQTQLYPISTRVHDQ